MLTELEIFGPRGGMPLLPLGGSGIDSDPLQVKNIDGLGPVKAVVNSTPYSLSDGEYYRGSSTGKRNIILTIGLSPNWIDQSMESLRQLLYNYFMPQQKVGLRFHSTHLPTVDISGYVESMDPNLFSQDPEMQISVLCLMPNFVATEPTVIEGVSSAFGSTDSVEIVYPGNLSAGFTLETELLPHLQYKIWDFELGMVTDPQNAMRISSEILSYFYPEVLTLSTVSGDKFIRTETQNNVIVNRLTDLADPTTWVQLRPGVNALYVYAAPDPISWSLTYTAQFGGL